MNIGRRLKDERERLGMSQTEFAAIAGASKHAQINWEKGDATPNANALAAWAEKGLDVLYVVTGSRSFVPPSPISSEHQAIIRDYDASSPDGKEAIRRMAAATALGAAAISGGSRPRAHAPRKYLGPVTHQDFHESAPVIGQVVTMKPRKKKS